MAIYYTYNIFFLLSILNISFIFLSVARGENMPPTISYTLTTKLLGSRSLSDPLTKSMLKQMGLHDRFRHRQDELKAVFQYLKHVESTPKITKVHKTVKNLNKVLKPFMDENCLIVVNNFEQIDIYPTVQFPLILRHFELGIGKVDYLEPKENQIVSESDLLWIPEIKVFKLNGNFSMTKLSETMWLRCSHIKYFYLLWPTDEDSHLCLPPNSHNLILSSRPWQCDVQVNLFMPDDLLKLSKYTKSLDSLHEFPRYSLPSWRPKVDILIEKKSSFDEYDQIALAAWTIKKSIRFGQSQGNVAPNHIQLISHAVCTIIFKNQLKTFSCNLKTMFAIFPCPECHHYIDVKLVNIFDLSFKLIAHLDRDQKFISFPGEVFSGGEFSLGGQIAHYINFQRETLKLPLKTLHKLKPRIADKMQMLSFAYASIYISFLGNLTKATTIHFEDPQRYFLYYLKRKGIIMNAKYEFYQTALRVNNLFGRLHFVSCGSRGIQALPFSQFLSIFEWEVWLLILISLTPLSFTIVQLPKDGRSLYPLLTWPLSIYKVFVEQGDPFPKIFDRSKPMRLIMAGTLLAGVVISNAFKSENVYTIVLPRALISYNNINELIEDNVALYTRIERYEYYQSWSPATKCKVINFHHYCKGSSLRLASWGELSTDRGSLADISNDTIKVRNHSTLNPEAVRAVIEPIHFLDDLVKVGILSLANVRKLAEGNALTNRFDEIQKKLVKNSLNNCTKVAWLLPNYQAQDMQRFLRKSEKHSDVSSNAYTWSEIAFQYSGSYVPSSILKQLSFIPNTGLLEWWPKFINRSDLVLGSGNNIPTKPSMNGNILVIFIFLAGGISAAIVCIALEKCRIVLKIEQKYEHFTALLRDLVVSCRNTIKKPACNVAFVNVKSVNVICDKILGSLNK